MTEHSSDKLQALGLLAAGVAHDFNNLLAIVEGYSYILQQRVGPVSALQDKIAAILAASRRGTELTQLLQSFYEPVIDQTASPSCDLIAVINHSKLMLRTLLGNRIDVLLHLPPSPIMISCRDDHLTEELILLTAEIHKTLNGSGGITISLDLLGDEAVISMTNNESGIHFSRSFPLMADRGLQDKTILVVDDESALLPVLEYQLQNMGLKVLKAANANSALLLQKDYPAAIDFLLTDIVMPYVGWCEAG